MRAISLILVSALGGLWVYFGIAVSPRDDAPPIAVPVAHQDELNAGTLNNAGVRLRLQGRAWDALAYFERAHSFRPQDGVIAANVERQRAGIAKQGWLRALIGGSVAWLVFAFFGGILRTARRVRDHFRLTRLRLRGDPYVRIRSDMRTAELPLRFSERVCGLMRRHPLTIVWSCAGHGKHMKSRPPVKVRGHEATVRLDGDRLDRLRRYPGEWNGFLYLGKTQVGRAAAKVG